MLDKISVIVVDDYELTHVGLSYMLEKISVVESVKQAYNGPELFKLLKENEPDLVLMDVQLEDESGIDVTRKLLNQVPDTLVIAITASKDVLHFTEMMDAGASGFMLKNATHEELEHAIDEVLAGRLYFSKEFKSVAKKLLPYHDKKSRIRLSEREKEVLKLICLGNSNQEIAETIGLSTHTVDAHRKKLLQKTGAKNTASMITMAIKEGIVDV